MIIPVFTGKQIAIVESLAKKIWTEHYTPIIGKEQVDYMLEKFQSKQVISEQIAEGFLYFLIVKDDLYIGYMGLQPKGEELFLSKIYVEDMERGRGYGRQCIEFIEKIAREEGFTNITLTVNKNNKNSIKAYEKFGFINLGAVVQDIGNGFIMDDYKMGKKVAR